MAWRSLTRVPPVEIGWARCWLLKGRSASPIPLVSRPAWALNNGLQWGSNRG